LDENFSRLITTFDEVPLLFARAQECTRLLARPLAAIATIVLT
jgi:hypothetical protein